MNGTGGLNCPMNTVVPEAKLRENIQPTVSRHPFFELPGGHGFGRHQTNPRS